MKNILIAVLGVFLFAGTVSAAVTIGKNLVRGEAWGAVQGEMDTLMYRVVDPKNGTTCYMSYSRNTGAGSQWVPEMDCVK